MFQTSSVSPMAELRFLYGRSPVAKPLCAKAATSSSRSMLPLGSWAACIRQSTQIRPKKALTASIHLHSEMRITVLVHPSEKRALRNG